MGLLLETVAEKELSDYEIERGKPMPNFLHSAIQINLGFELKLAYGEHYRVVSELTLDTQPKGSTPDLSILKTTPLDFINELPARHPDAPLLTIEIESPSQSMDEMTEKMRRYFAFGVKSCWIVIPPLKAICVYNKPNHYEFFHNDDKLIDKKLNIELDLSKIFE
jgi:Uma2 family endonuclease